MLKVAGKHPNVVTMQAFFEDQEAYYIVMEMCEGGELFHRLADKVIFFFFRLVPYLQLSFLTLTCVVCLVLSIEPRYMAA